MTSETWIMAEDDERPWLLRIWVECWRSVPVGSMPDSRQLFARRIGCSRQFLEAHGEILLRGWRLHNDGRLYHDYISSQVLDVLEKRIKDSRKMRRYRERQKTKENNGNSESVTVTDGSVTVSNPCVTGGREGKVREGKLKEEKATDATHQSPTFAAAKAEPAVGSCPYAKIRELWVAKLPELTKPASVEHWTQARKAQLRARWADQLPDMEAWEDCFSAIRRSKFLMGQSSPQNGRKPFRADLFWITKPENLLKLAEGRYDG